MRNLHVSCYKILMLLIVALTIFYSCTADEDIFLEAVNHDGIEELNTIDQGSSETSSSDPIPLNQTDTTDVTDKPSNIPIALATPSSGVPPLEVTFSVSNSLTDKTFFKYEWKFKDGTKASSSKAVHTFKEVGKHEVELTATDEEGQILVDSVTVTVIESENELPLAAATASPSSGSAPLDVRFKGSGSTDDNGIKSYLWDFKDGSSSTETDPSHEFSKPGTYQVELTVTDEKDMTDKATVTITVEEPVNQAPVAVASASVLSGDAPLQVDFTGSDSSDDKGVVDYSWDFQDGSFSDQANTSHTFNAPGVYDIALTVTDAEGLTDTANLTVTVNQGSTGNPGGDNIPCGVGGGMANETGEKVWCWKDVNVPGYSGNSGVPFSNNELSFASECNEQQVSKVGDGLRFNVNPTSPEPGNWCNNEYNMRAEISTLPWNVRNPLGTEEWFGWDYTFGNDYAIDAKNSFLFFQIHNGVVGTSPAVELTIAQAGRLDNSAAGTLFVENNANASNNNIYDYKNTGIVPVAGQILEIVVHVIWGRGTDGLLQVWVDGNKIYDKRVDTAYNGSPWGGNAKWGIYKWGWRDKVSVQESLDTGVSHLETFMGPLRMITRRPGDPDYRKDSYAEVAPD